ncbi:MAG: hypothetical protein IAG13_25095 [Deltaproteobacteria bacterium]|nr:hypothetical protein [Nannocystaceae bacterium]
MAHASRRLILTLALVAVAGCGKQRPAIEVPDAALGRVIVYRNGVAYFERRAMVQGQLTLQVPRERVDDFLKSLTVVDAETDEPLPISYPTAHTSSGGTVSMTIALPKGRRDVRIAYVTESPAWKPSYRVMLAAQGRARLQSWAIVDNVSNESWNQVMVGVGSTSALSFRYDLHSVQLVERETIDGGDRIAAAPPEGGSPYAVEGGNVRVLAGLSQLELDEMAAIPIGVPNGREFSAVVESSATATYDAAGISLSHSAGTTKRGVPGRVGRKKPTVAPENHAPPAAAEVVTSANGVDALVAGLAGNAQRVRVEGWSRADEHDDSGGLRRANTLRDRMISAGIAAERIDVVAHREAAGDEQLVRVVAVDESPTPVQARVHEDDAGPRGIAHFMTKAPMTIAAGHSAMVTLYDGHTRAERVYLYDPVSERGSQVYAFNAVRIVNPTDNTLDSGPITVYAERQFLGEGLTEPIPPKAAALVPFGVDRSLVIDPVVETREEIERLRKVERGIATTEILRIRRTQLELSNRGHADARVFVRHRVASGWTLRDPPKDLERMRGDVLLPISVGAGKTVSLVIEESMPTITAIDLRSAPGLRAVEVFLAGGKPDSELRTDLEAILAVQRKLVGVDETLSTRRAHAETLRLRIGELADQLVALRKVGRAQSLSGHLAKRMRSLGDRLDGVAAEIGDLETRRLETGIELDNLVADLSLSGTAVGSAGGGARGGASP